MSTRFVEKNAEFFYNDALMMWVEFQA